MRLLFVVGLILGAWAGSTGPAPAAEPPYQLEIRLHFFPHRLMTPTFRKQLIAEVEDSLHAALGDLAAAAVLDADALTPEKGRESLPLERRSHIDDRKVHQVDLSYVDGRYQIRARQYDGSTGQLSPVWRQGSTADRAYVARLILAFLEQDFGSVGTLLQYDKSSERVTLQLRGSSLEGRDLDRWAPAGSVFAIVRLEGSPLRGRALEDAYLVLDKKLGPGRWECQFVYRYRDQLADLGADSPFFRAIRLGTTTAPLRLQFSDRNGVPVSGVQVSIRKDGFQSAGAPLDQGSLRDGRFESNRPYGPLAFIRVSSGEQSLAQIPVPILDNRLVLIRMNPGAQGELRQQMELDARAYKNRLQDILVRLREFNRRLEPLLRESKNREALDLTRNALERLENEIQLLEPELGHLRREAERSQVAIAPVLDQAEIGIREIRKRRQLLVQARDDLESAIRVEQSPEARAARDNFLALWQRADHLMVEADFEGAQRLYEEILQKHGQRENVRARLDQLKKDWAIQSEEHRSARAFIYGTWAGMKSLEDIRKNLGAAREAWKTCQKANDRLTPRKLYLVATTQATEILERAIDDLTRNQQDEDRIALKQVESVKAELEKLIQEVDAALRKDS